jgi:hypothetical protein
MKTSTYLYLGFAIVLLEVLSFFSWRFPVLGVVCWVLICAGTFAIALVKPVYGAGIALVELILGGKGYLWSLPIGNYDISIRLGIFLALILASIFISINAKNFWGLQYRFRWAWLGMIAIVGWATICGLLSGHGFGAVFNDMNAFLFIGLVPFFGLLKSREDIYLLLKISTVGLLVLALKTGITQALFTHYPSTELVLLYKWIRDTGVGEITYIIGHLYRIFFQSHIWGIFGFFTFIGMAISKPKQWLRWTLVAAVSIFVVIVSLSRSFWLGGGVALILALIVILSRQVSRKYFFRIAALGLSALIIGYIGFQWSLNFPYLWNHSGGGSLVQARAEITTESAASSRRELLPVMNSVILKKPILGSGFGTALTYRTKDPRVNSSGSSTGSLYTTTAFELGYHAFALQFGLPLTLVFIGILFYFFWTGWKLLAIQQVDKGIIGGLLASLVALYVVNLTTPYLNHPLGIGMIILITTTFCIFDPRHAQR